MSGKKTSFGMGNEFNGYARETYLKGTDRQLYPSLSQTDVRVLTNLNSFLGLAQGAIPVYIDANQADLDTAMAIGAISQVNMVYVTYNEKTHTTTQTFQVVSGGVSTGSYFRGNTNSSDKNILKIIPSGWIPFGTMGWKWGEKTGNYYKKEGWLEEKGNWYYFQNEWMVTGWQQITYEGKLQWFFFKTWKDPQGVERAGHMATGWLEIKYNGVDQWFYFHGNGTLAVDEWIDYRGTDGNWYYCGSDGSMRKSQLRVGTDGNLYYLKDDGAMAVSEAITDPASGKNYYADINGVCSLLESTSGDINDIWDQVTINRILTLHPEIRQNTVDFILDAQGQRIKLRITQAYCSIEEQDRLYNQSRNGNTGSWATNAKGGQSYHNYGLAIDVVEIVNGAANWEFDTKKVASIAMNHGFEWPLPVDDAGHFQISCGYSWQQLLQKVKNNQMKDGYVIL